jgi:hypothetical protein
MVEKKNREKITSRKATPIIDQETAFNISSNIANRVGARALKSTLRAAVPEPKLSWKPGLSREVLEVQTPIEGKKQFLTSIDPKTGEVLRWYDPDAAPVTITRAMGVTRTRTMEVDHAEALQQAEETLKKTDTAIPANAVSKVSEIDQAKAGVKYVVEWKHQIDGVEVEGDFIRVTFNAETMKPMMFSKNWTDVESTINNTPLRTSTGPLNLQEIDNIAKSKIRQQINLSRQSYLCESIYKNYKNKGASSRQS